jgi:hypothetical protein
MKKEAWSVVNEKLNAKHGLNLTSEQVKNQKNAFRKIFFEYKLLCCQSGFGWDEEKGLATADNRVWEELIEAHPRRELAKFKDKPFPLYNLASSVWDGTAATGDFAKSALPPPTTKATKLPSSSKRKIFSADNDASDGDVENPLVSLQTSTTAATKRVRESKNQVIKNEMDGINGAIAAVSETSKELLGAFSQIATAISGNNSNETPKPNKPPSGSSAKSTSELALDICAKNFLGKVPDKMYVDFISILENKAKAETFLAISRNSNNCICQIWLEKEVKKNQVP